MKVTVKLFSTFVDSFGGNQKEYVLNDGATIQDLLLAMCDNQERREKVFDEFGRVRPHIQLFKNQQTVRALEGVNTKLADGDLVSVMPIVAAG